MHLSRWKQKCIRHLTNQLDFLLRCLYLPHQGKWVKLHQIYRLLQLLCTRLPLHQVTWSLRLQILLGRWQLHQGYQIKQRLQSLLASLQLHHGYQTKLLPTYTHHQLLLGSLHLHLNTRINVHLAARNLLLWIQPLAKSSLLLNQFSVTRLKLTRRKMMEMPKGILIPVFLLKRIFMKSNALSISENAMDEQSIKCDGRVARKETTHGNRRRTSATLQVSKDVAFAFIIFYLRLT